MSFFWTLLIGLLAGTAAKLVMPGKDPGGWIVTTLLGIAGAFVANFLGRMIGWYQEGEAASFIASIAGAVILLAFYRMIRKPKAG